MDLSKSKELQVEYGSIQSRIFDGVQSITRNFKYITDYVNGGSTSSGVY